MEGQVSRASGSSWGIGQEFQKGSLLSGKPGY